MLSTALTFASRSLLRERLAAPLKSARCTYPVLTPFSVVMRLAGRNPLQKGIPPGAPATGRSVKRDWIRVDISDSFDRCYPGVHRTTADRCIGDHRRVVSRGVSIAAVFPHPASSQTEARVTAGVRVGNFIEALADDKRARRTRRDGLRENGVAWDCTAEHDRIRLTGGGACSQWSSTLIFRVRQQRPAFNGRIYSRISLPCRRRPWKCLLIAAPFGRGNYQPDWPRGLAAGSIGD